MQEQLGRPPIFFCLLLMLAVGLYVLALYVSIELQEVAVSRGLKGRGGGEFEGFGAGIALIESVVSLWFVLALLLLASAVSGQMPWWAMAMAVFLLVFPDPITLLTAAIGGQGTWRDRATSLFVIGFVFQIPALFAGELSLKLIPPLVAFYAIWARFPQLRARLPAALPPSSVYILIFLIAVALRFPHFLNYDIAAYRQVRDRIAAALNVPKPQATSQAPVVKAPVVTQAPPAAVSEFARATSRDWRDASDDAIPTGAVVIGREAAPREEKLYLCRATAEDGSLQVGKVRPGFGACKVPLGRIEHSFTRYQVFVGEGFGWSTQGGMPERAVQAGTDIAPEYVPMFACRANFQGGLHPGKTRADWDSCHIGWGGREYPIEPYEVLIRR